MASHSQATEFYRVLTEAINDMMEHGFDSQERLDKWLAALARAAREALIPESALVQLLKGELGKKFKRASSTEKLMRANPGVSKFTIDMIKPKLRAELDRRIVASANLIKLNREAEIAKTLQRFAGWASSVPAGGTDVAKRKKVKQTVRRGIAALPFQERVVVIDQGHKLTAAVNEIVAVDGGAIAMEWLHVGELGTGYTPRPNHVARNGRFYVLRNSWAMDKGYLKRQYFYDEITAVGEEPMCRCTARWCYALRDLPVGMLTAKGKEALENARTLVRAL